MRFAGTNTGDETVTTTPHVNLNGTSREQLVEQQVAFCEALSAAIQVLREAAPNARDYQRPGEQTDYLADCAEHQRRDRTLHAMLADVEATAYAISQSAS